MSKYECATCANRNTPLCDLCSVIEHAGEALRPPTLFCKTDNLPPDENEVYTTDQEFLVSVINRYLRAEKPIPLNVVMMYNRMRADEDMGV